jgi:hypothetical protein
MRKLVFGILGATALVGASAANAVEFVGSTLGCFGSGCTPGTPATNTYNGLTFGSGSFDQNTSAGGFAGIGSGNTDTLGFVSQNGSLFNYTGTAFSLLVNFTAPSGVSAGSNFQALLTGDVSGANNGGVHFVFTNPTQSFTYPGGAFTLTVDNFTVSGTDINTPITGFIQAAAVPEPATWALMLVGFGGIGFAMRRRRRPVLAQVA